LSQSRYVAEHIAGAKYLEVSSSTDFDTTLDDVEAFVTGRLPEVAVDRVLATVLFTDIVDSTAQAATVGDRAWRHRLDEHDAMVRRHLARFRGREIKTMGDGFLASFDGPARAIRCACAIRDDARQLGIAVRAGLHTGEIELLGDDIGGVAVNIGSRVAALAGPAEVLVSRTVTDLVAGSGIAFEDQGEHELKGIPGLWRLFAVAHT
jgi:class 3 adenylate cyclase